MQTANELAEIEYDGGREMSGQECLDRLAYAQKRKSWMLRNTQSCFLEEWAYEEGHVKDLFNHAARNPYFASDFFNDMLYKLSAQADRMAMQEEAGLSWDEIKERLSDDKT